MREATAGENELDLDELERLARAAARDKAVLGWYDETVLSQDRVAKEDRPFIAAANPQAILSLIVALRAKETETRAERAEHSLAESDDRG